METNINARDIKWLEEIGRGTHSHVFKAEWKNKTIAVKKYSKEKIKCHNILSFSNLLYVDNENILKLYGRAENPGLFKNSSPLLLMEYMECGTLHDRINGPEALGYQTSEALNWMHQCAKGMAFLHANKPHQIVHYNLRPTKLYLTDNFQQLKIGYFTSNPIWNRRLLKRPYDAPEGDMKLFTGEKFDVYSFGVILWEVLSQQKPNFLNDFNLPLTLSSDSVRTLIKSCLNPDFLKRPNMEAVATSISGFMSSFKSIILENKDMVLGESIGSGAFGTVYKAQLRSVQYAVKKCSIDDLDAQEAIEKEVQYLSQASHKNIIKLFGIMLSTDNKTMIVMEFADCGTLYNYVHKKQSKRNYTYLAALNWMNQLAQGLEYLHAMKPKPIIHRDIKTKNLLLANRYRTLKIGDFGTVSEQATYMTQTVGTAPYMAPEVAQGKRYTEKSDVYSFGIVCWEVMSNRMPFYHLENSEVLTIIFAVSKGQRPSIHDLLVDKNREQIQTMIQNCWHEEPEKRSSMTDIVLMLSIDYTTSDLSSFNIKLLSQTRDLDYPLDE